KFAPDEKITREQMAVMAYRYAIYMGYSVQMAQELTYADSEDISPFAQNAVKWASAEGILNGSDSGCFYPQKTTTRAEAAALFMRLYERMQTGGEK
ncbi:MAG: S-layer homology domain-containing protein, partial [Oscillospiraceae bacterium]|nr:S-layer homology domain-containing protein [Oscillospiraceae bacterium]